MFLLLLFLFVFSSAALAAVDVNHASQAELESLPGIGPAKASAIIAYRQEHGPFEDLDDLDAVPGIGPATLQKLAPLVVFGDDQPAAEHRPADDTTTEAPAADQEAITGPIPARPSAGAGLVNINTATQAELESLPGIGPSKAAAIIADREANGPYASCDDLQRVRGIGAATVASLRERCAVE